MGKIHWGSCPLDSFGSRCMGPTDMVANHWPYWDHTWAESETWTRIRDKKSVFLKSLGYQSCYIVVNRSLLCDFIPTFFHISPWNFPDEDFTMKIVSSRCVLYVKYCITIYNVAKLWKSFFLRLINLKVSQLLWAPACLPIGFRLGCF